MSTVEVEALQACWECGYLFEESSRTLFCGDLFTQPGAEHAPIIETDILGPSEAMRSQMDYFAHAKNTGELLGKLAATEWRACMARHGLAMVPLF